MTSDEIETAVDEFLNRATVDYSAVADGKSTASDEWKFDRWQISFYRRAKAVSAEFEFRTGIGLRSKRHNVPVKPKAASVLACLVRDAAALSQSFDDWCADFGYDSDSMKAFNIYRECCANGKKLTAIFSRAEIAKLEELTAEY